jgi:hypothetical protein
VRGGVGGARLCLRVLILHLGDRRVQGRAAAGWKACVALKSPDQPAVARRKAQGGRGVGVGCVRGR